MRTEFIRTLLDEADMPDVYKAVNGLQDTAWRVNERVLEVMQTVWEKNLGTGMPPSDPYVPPACPVPKDLTADKMTPQQIEAFNDWKAEAREVYTLEKNRVGNVVGIARTMRLASMLKTKELLHFVYQLDFRGRGYSATSGVSPQGADPAKAVLQFAKAERLGQDGLYWLKVHGANKYGYDKPSYDARVEWIEQEHEAWLAVAADPIGQRSVWGAADKPFQFLAFCFEYAEATILGEDFRSSLPIALDGSCNGLQHFSAMLRDAVGGQAVNLTPGDKPSDIYQSVADVCTARLRVIATENSEHSAAALNWLDLFKHLGSEGMGRKLAKKPVMTLPYGSTMQACTSSIYQWYVEQRVKFFPHGTAFRHAIFLSRVLWDSIGEVVIAARQAMSWIQKCSGVISKEGAALHYHTPLGFPVYQITMEQEMKRIVTQIGGRLELAVSRDTEELSARKQRQGSSPNLVHSVDACHMQMCVNAGLDAGITDFAMIHDDFGVHACHVPKWHTIIREQFVRLHSDNDVLQQFKDEHEQRLGIDLPDLPARGSLDLQGVLASPYFFG
jgi:DNA-directed RNA polymerase